jgi:nicotinamide mononucleotide adenylyltransferase
MRSVGVIGRFKPLHNGSAAMLDAVCDAAEEAIIVVGSANRYDARNPFTYEETRGMIDTYLAPRRNYRILPLHDYGHLPGGEDGMMWKEVAIAALGDIDALVTGNAYVASLLGERYRIIHPETMVQTPSSHATAIRAAMAKDETWEAMVPSAVAEYLRNEGLVERFRREFGDHAQGRSPQNAEEEHDAVSAAH